MALSTKAKNIGERPYFPPTGQTVNNGITIRQHLIESFMAAILSNPDYIDAMLKLKSRMAQTAERGDSFFITDAVVYANAVLEAMAGAEK